jgi:superfamily II DNA/RNA helicase
MDLPDIQLVIQWKATCDLCTLWQRFGRGGRGSDQLATAILLVEKKDTNEECLQKAERAAKRKAKKRGEIGTKRQAKDQLNMQLKRPALANRNINSARINNQQVEEPHSDIDIDIESVEDEIEGDRDIASDEERRAQYQKEGRLKTTTSNRVERRVEVGSAMDDFINTRSCRRKIPTLFFGNDKTRMFHIAIVDRFLMNRQRQTIINCVTIHHLKVVNAACRNIQQFVVTSATLPSLTNTTSLQRGNLEALASQSSDRRWR